MFAEKVIEAGWVDYALLEMNIIPIPHEWKRPDYRWRRLRWTKLHVLMDSRKGQMLLQRFFDLGGDGLAVLCGRPSENLFVIDCDSAEALESVRRQLIARDIDVACVRSSRGGHLYLRAREGAVKTIAAGVIKDVEIRGDGALVVLPPTWHQSGIVYQWEGGHPPRHIPTVSVQQIDFLRDSDGQTVQLSVMGGARRLHDTTRDYLRRGRHLAEGTRNSRLFDAARDYKYVGRDSGAALHDLLPMVVQSGLDADAATATILSPYKSSRSIAQPVSQTEQLQAFAENVKWGGRKGQTDRRVFEALIRRRKADAHRHGKGAFRASYRELMVLSRFNSWRTIDRSLKRLKRLGFIADAGQDAESRANLYRMSGLVLGAGEFFLSQRVHTKQQVSSRSDYCGHFAQVAESNCLGATGTAILNLLRSTPPPNSLPASGEGGFSSREIAAASGCHRSTVNRHLRNLIDRGLVAGARYRYWALNVTAADERALVVETGAYRKDMARQQRFDVDRALFALNPILEFLWTQKQEEKAI